MWIRLIVLVGLLFLAACAGAPTSQEVTEHVRVTRGPNHATAVMLPVTIHGQGPFTFELDTGASTSLLSPTLVQRLSLHATGKTETISGIGGVQKATPVSISNWNTGPIRLPAATIVSSAIPHERGSGLDGLIGSDIWSRFGKFTLDYTSGTLAVYQQIAASSGSPRDQKGEVYPAVSETLVRIGCWHRS